MSSALPYYKFYFLNEFGDYYKVNDAGAVIITNTKTPVTSPISWENTQIKWIRSMSYLGLIRSLTTGYEWVLDSAKILKNIASREGVEGFCTLKIEMANVATGTWDYSDFASFGLDFSTIFANDIVVVNNVLEKSVKISAIEDGVYKYLRLNENVPYEILIDPADSLSVQVDGITLQGVYEYAPIAGTVTSSEVMIGTAFYSQDGAYDVANTNNQLRQLIDTSGGAIIPSRTENFSYEAIIDQTGTFYMKQRVTVTNDGGSSGTVISFIVRLVVADPPPNSSTSATITVSQVVHTEVLSISPGNSQAFEFEFDYTSPIPVNKGQRLYVIFDATTTGGITNYTIDWDENSGATTDYKFSWRAIFQRPLSVAAGYRYYQAYNKLISLMTEGNYEGFSSYLSSNSSIAYDLRPFRTVLTCGDALRGLPGAKIKTTLKQMFKDASTQWCMGLGVNSANKVIMEPLKVFFNKDSFVADLGDVSMKWEPATDFIFSSAKYGYPNTTYDEINGRESYMGSITSKLPITRKVEERDWVSDYIWDCYGIEYTRANILNKKTVDTSTDNSTYALVTINNTLGGNWLLQYPQTSSGAFDSQSNYNIAGTPGRKLRRNSPLLAAATHNRPSSLKITFQTADKNSKLVSKFLASTAITEKADILISALGSPLFQPIFFKFTTLVPINIAYYQSTNPYGYFTFKDQNGVQWKGFLMEVALTPATDQVYEWIFLSHPDNNVALLP